MKKVGIVIPSYNQGKYLERCILSVLENAKKCHMKIALIDGGSTDESVQIIEQYKEHFTYWCSEPDKGQANAINKGIEKLHECDYYLWLNSDDVYEGPDSLKRMIEFAVENKFEVCYGLSHFIDEKDAVIGEYPVESYSIEKLGNRCFLSQPSVMFSKKAYQTVGPLNEDMRMCLDYEYWMRLAQHFEFGFFEDYVGATRMYGDTKTSTLQKVHLTEAIVILNKYYGKVPMHWIVTKILCDNPRSIYAKIPKRILFLLCMPKRKKVIEQCIKENNN